MQAGPSRHWTVQEIPYGSIDRQRARADPYLLYLVAGASFVAITSDLYAGNLAEYFAGDSGLSQWLRERWEPEEKQHGRALRRYVETVWPELDWEKAYQGFYAEYAHFCAVSKLGPTRALELASRCVVETGTATFYATLAKVRPEPVLAELANRIKDDESRHYNLFLYHYGRWAASEGTGRDAVLAALRGRMEELDQEDIYCASKHVFQALHPGQRFTLADHWRIKRHYTRLARRHYPYRTAARMLLRPLRLGASCSRRQHPFSPLPAGSSCPDANCPSTEGRCPLFHPPIDLESHHDRPYLFCNPLQQAPRPATSLGFRRGIPRGSALSPDNVGSSSRPGPDCARTLSRGSYLPVGRPQGSVARLLGRRVGHTARLCPHVRARTGRLLVDRSAVRGNRAFRGELAGGSAAERGSHRRGIATLRHLDGAHHQRGLGAGNRPPTALGRWPRGLD